MSESYDLVVVGGGPAGATTALVAARSGLRVVLLERERHPRFHIGESFLPRNLTLLRELGLTDKLNQLPQTKKLGASFALGHEEEVTDFDFRDGLRPDCYEAFNIERAPFDAMLFDAAAEAGAKAEQEFDVKRLDRLEEGGVELTGVDAEGRERRLEGRYLADASGQATCVGRHLGIRRPAPDLQRVAYYGHYTGVPRRAGEKAGYPLVVMCREGWFWVIPIDEERTSLGLVMAAEAARKSGVLANQRLAWGLERTPILRRLMKDSDGPEKNRVTADFSYACRPYAGPGYFLVGDAATFIDPIFSTGVCLGMMSGVVVANSVARILGEGASPGVEQRDYIRYVERTSGVFFRLVRRYYRHPFRELLLQGQGPFEVHRGIISILTGDVFPRPRWDLRSRLYLMEGFTWLQSLFAAAPRRPEFSLLEPSGP